MQKQIFDLLSQSPTLSILLGFLLAGFLAYIFRGLIKDYFKKKYNLYDVEQITNALTIASEERIFYQKATEKLTPTVTERVLKILDNEKYKK